MKNVLILKSCSNKLDLKYNTEQKFWGDCKIKGLTVIFACILYFPSSTPTNWQLSSSTDDDKILNRSLSRENNDSRIFMSCFKAWRHAIRSVSTHECIILFKAIDKNVLIPFILRFSCYDSSIMATFQHLRMRCRKWQIGQKLLLY